MKKIGLIGGLSWVSTLTYYQLINQLINQRLGRHHAAHLVLESIDEEVFLQQQAQDNGEQLCEKIILEAIAVLIEAKAEIIALCANGIHRFEPAIKKHYPNYQFIHIAQVTAQAVAISKIKKVGLLGVKATMTGSFYRNKLQPLGIEVLTPNKTQQQLIHQKIIDELTQRSFSSETKTLFLAIMQELIENGAQGIIMGCTEIPLLITDSHINGIPLFSTTAIHCEAIVQHALQTNTLKAIPNRTNNQ